MTIAVLISGQGGNLRAILESSVGKSVSAIISDNPQAAGLQAALEHDKAAYSLSPADFDKHSDWENKLGELLEAVQPRIIALAGFMRILGADSVSRFAGRMLNIHPSLLPDFPGLNTHRRALAAGVKEHGCTIHWVCKKVDGGEIIAQKKVPVLADDTPETLAARVSVAEHALYPAVLAELINKA